MPVRLAACLTLAAVAAAGAAPAPARDWPGEELPLPLAVRTPEDLAFKQVAERQYLEFNLLASGKAAYDRADFATAAARWDALLAIPGLAPEVERVVRPLADDARARTGGASPSRAAPIATPNPPPRTSVPRPRVALVRGEVTGGGPLGPGGAVVWLTRADGQTPRPHPAERTLLQRNKQFIPRVLAVPVGSTVHFRNEDDLFHNVFSLSRPNDFDLGLYKSGVARDQTFRTPGPVNLLCNIHASMVGYVYVVDSPWYGQADVAGAWRIPGVPPGEYVLHAWHEAGLEPVTRPLTVRGDVVPVPPFAVNSDRPPMTFVPDKAGKPRQTQLGY